MHQTREGNQWYFGMKAHIGVDSKEGIVHSVCSTAASVSDVPMLPDLLHGGENKVWGDGGYQGQTKKIREAAPNAQDMTSRRVKTKAGVDEEEKRKNRTKARVRAKVEWPFPCTEARLRPREGALSRLEEESRMAVPVESLPGQNHVVILTHALWKHLGAGHIIGHTLRIDGDVYSVVGILEPGIADRDVFQLTVPLVFAADEIKQNDLPLVVVGRLRSGVNMQRTEQELDAAITNLPERKSGQVRSLVSVRPLKKSMATMSSAMKEELWLLLCPEEYSRKDCVSLSIAATQGRRYQASASAQTGVRTAEQPNP